MNFPNFNYCGYNGTLMNATKRAFDVNDTCFIIRLKEKKDISMEGFESAKDDFRGVLTEHKKQVVFRAWLDDVKARAQIERDLSRI